MGVAAIVHDNRAHLAQQPAHQRKILQMIAGDEGEVVGVADGPCGAGGGVDAAVGVGDVEDGKKGGFGRVTLNTPLANFAVILSGSIS